jgi:hypothetical protein
VTTDPVRTRVTGTQIEHPVADVLRVLAVSRSSGALEVRGPRSGTFFLHEGDITYAEARGLPPAEEFDATDPRLRSTIQSSIVEVGLALLVSENTEGERPLFRPGRRHWSGRAVRVEVTALLYEIACQKAYFRKLGVDPDDRVELRGLSSGRPVVLSRRQWALAAQMSGPQTARSLASRSGAPLRVTIENLASLVLAGVVERGAPLREPPAAASAVREQPVVPARPPVVREPPGGGSPVREPESALPQRVRGATPLPPAAALPLPPAAALPRTSSPAAPSPAAPPSSAAPNRPRKQSRPPDDPADSGRALALRLLEGLRRS